MSKTALLFPGQGAQAVGMARDLAGAFPECRALFDRAAAVLGYDLAAICFEGPIEKLTISAHAQPGIFVASVACLTALQQKYPGVAFDFTAGLSSGEWTALYFAGAISFEDTLTVNFASCIIEADVERRFFQKLVEDGIPVTIESNREL